MTEGVPPTSRVRVEIGQDGAFVGGDGADDAGEAGADAVPGGALALDDPVGGAAGAVVDLGAHVVGEGGADLGCEGGEGGGAGAGGGPGENLAVAMFAKDIGVDGLRCDAKVAADKTAEAGGVKDGAGADHAGGRQAGEAGGDMGHHVDGVGGDEEDRIGGGAGDAGDDCAKHLGVAFEKLEAGFAGGLGDTGGEDDDARTCEVRVVASADGDGAAEGDGMRDILGLGDGAGGVVVDHHDLAMRRRQGRGRRRRRCRPCLFRRSRPSWLPPG